MNCTANARYLGRGLTFTSTDGKVSRISHEASMPLGMIASMNEQPTERDDITIRFEDGGEVCLSVLGSNFTAKPGQQVTAVRAAGVGDEPLLYCMNHETKDEWFNRAGLAQLRSGAPLRRMLWLLPLIALIGAWLSPAETRAELADWAEEAIPLPSQPVQTASLDGSRMRARAAEPQPQPVLHELARHAKEFVTPSEASSSRADAAAAIGRTSADFALDGWRSRNWFAFSALVLLVIPLCLMLGHVGVVWPATVALRRRVKRLAQQHCKATEAA